jgi:hypothetical protein
MLDIMGPRAPTAIHGALGLKFHPMDKAIAIAVSKTSSHHTTCVTKNMNGGWRPESKLCSEPKIITPTPRKDKAM